MAETTAIRIAPSILSADFAALGAEIAAVEAAGADWIHVDPMDGHFVPNLSMGPMVVAAIRRHVTTFIDVHLMISPAEPWLGDFARAGSDLITVHAEAGPHLHRSLQSIREAGARAGVAINPGTPVSALESVIDAVDLILVMSVNPGFGGQSFIAHSIAKLRQAKALIGDRPVMLEVDGGISPATAEAAAAAGAQVLVAGSAVFTGGPSVYAANITALRAAAEAGTRRGRAPGKTIT